MLEVLPMIAIRNILRYKKLCDYVLRIALASSLTVSACDGQSYSAERTPELSSDQGNKASQKPI